MLLSSLRNFFIALLISVIVFGIGAYFLTGFLNKMGNDFLDPSVKPDEPNTNEEGHIIDSGDPDLEDDSEEEEIIQFNVLIIGIDDGKSQPVAYENDENEDRRKEADTIFLVNINPETKTLMMSSLPTNMKVEIGRYNLRLGAVYSYGEYGNYSTNGGKGMELMTETVWAYTGVEADYCCVVDYDSLEVFFNMLGEIEYIIPEDMYYKPEPYDRTTTDPPTETQDENEPTLPPPPTTTEEETTNRNIIELKKGRQFIDGAAAVQLLRYNNYRPNEDNRNRASIQIDFIKEVLRQMMTVENLARAGDIYAGIKELLFPDEEDLKNIKEYNENKEEDEEEKKEIKSEFKTNFNEKEFKYYAKTIFSLAEYAIKEVVYPSNSVERTEHGTLFFYPDIKSAISRYRDYRKVEKPEIPEITEKPEEVTDMDN